MSRVQTASLHEAAAALSRGEVIAYPTEAVFGLGCDPDNEQAIQRLLDLKQRSAGKGLIIIASEVQQLDAYVETRSSEQWQKVLTTRPGAISWLMPVRATVSRLITGERETIAVRITTHPVAKALCQLFAKPIISTSANITNRPAAKNVAEILSQFKQQPLACILDGEVDPQANPSEIHDLLSGKVIRGY